jgi:ribosome maturation factor RimP
MHSKLTETLTTLLTPAVQGAGYELVDLQWKHEQGGWVLRVMIDKPVGSIGHDDCERVSREVSALLDVHDVIKPHYSLEVSSPGLDRPLRTPQHFARFIGQKARVRLQHGLDGRRNFAGTIVDVGADTVTLDVDGAPFTLPLSDLEKANLEFQFPKPSTGR